MSPGIAPASQGGTNMRLSTIVAVAMLMVPANPALAGDKTEGWAKWVERAELIEAAMSVGEENFKPQIKAACSGVTGTVIGQGFQFPYWAQNLIQVCTVLKDNWLYTSGKRKCSDAKKIIANLNKATPVEENPRADRIAKNIAEMLQISYDVQCKR
jgi:hypothetical protein